MEDREEEKGPLMLASSDGCCGFFTREAELRRGFCRMEAPLSVLYSLPCSRAALPTLAAPIEHQRGVVLLVHFGRCTYPLLRRCPENSCNFSGHGCSILDMPHPLPGDIFVRVEYANGPYCCRNNAAKERGA